MTSGRMNRSLVQGIVLKVGFPLLIGLITLVAANIGGMQVRNTSGAGCDSRVWRRARSLHRGH